MRKEPKPGTVIAVDFDGTLCRSAWPAIGYPNYSLINSLKRWQRHGCRLILWTCREGDMLREALTWCHRWGLYFDTVNENLPERVAKYGGDCRKVSADIYIDDRAYRVWRG